MAHEVGTVMIKMTDSELEITIACLEFYTTLDLPVDGEYLKPYDKLKHDLIRVKQQLEDYKHEVRHGKKEIITTGVFRPEDDEACD